MLFGKKSLLIVTNLTRIRMKFRLIVCLDIIASFLFVFLFLFFFSFSFFLRKNIINCFFFHNLIIEIRFKPWMPLLDKTYNTCNISLLWIFCPLTCYYTCIQYHSNIFFSNSFLLFFINEKKKKKKNLMTYIYILI